MSNKIITSSRMDEQVLFTFLCVGLLCIIILGFRYSTTATCAPVKILFAGDLTQGKPIRFSAETKDGKSFAWDFGDNELAEEEAASTTHIFKTPGKYTVSVTVNESCTQIQDVSIKQAVVNRYNDLHPNINSLDSVFVGDQVMFTDQSIHSISWKWNFGEPGAAESTVRNPVFVFQTPGIKNITLIVNDNPELLDKKTIYVRVRELPKKNDTKTDERNKPRPIIINSNPVAPPLTLPKTDEPPKKENTEPVIVKAPDAPDGLIKNILLEVSDGTNWADRISKYVCNDLTIPVFYDKRTITLTQLCEEIKKIKRKKIKDIKVTTIVSKQTNCIQSMNVTIDKKSFLGL